MQGRSDALIQAAELTPPAPAAGAGVLHEEPALALVKVSLLRVEGLGHLYRGGAAAAQQQLQQQQQQQQDRAAAQGAAEAVAGASPPKGSIAAMAAGLAGGKAGVGTGVLFSCAALGWLLCGALLAPGPACLLRLPGL